MRTGRTNQRGLSIGQSVQRRWQRALFLWPALVLVMSGAAAPAHAQFLYRQLGLPELAQRAPIIVQGQVIEARYEGHPDYPHVKTVLVTLRVEQMLRGPAEERLSSVSYTHLTLPTKRIV